MPKKITRWTGDTNEFMKFKKVVRKKTGALCNIQLGALVYAFRTVDHEGAEETPEPNTRPARLKYCRECYHLLWRISHTLGDKVDRNTDPAELLENADKILKRHEELTNKVQPVVLD